MTKDELDELSDLPVFHLEAPTCKSNDGYLFVTALPPVCQIFMHVSVLPSLNGCSSFNGSRPSTWSQQTHTLHIFVETEKVVT